MTHSSLLPARGLYAVTLDGEDHDAQRLQHAVAAALRGGARLLQYRDKRNSRDQRARLAAGLLAQCRQARVPLIINDDLELAAQLGADGVHLGLADAGLAEARARLGPKAIIGITCANSLERARAAAGGGASYIALGAFFASATKPNAPTASLELLREARAELTLPICAIGGITPDNGAALLAAGADYLAVIGSLFGHDSVAAIETTASRFRDLFAD